MSESGVVRVRPKVAREFTCSCGKLWPSARSRASHRRTCAVELAVRAWELAEVLDALDAARARGSAVRG